MRLKTPLEIHIEWLEGFIEGQQEAAKDLLDLFYVYGLQEALENAKMLNDSLS